MRSTKSALKLTRKLSEFALDETTRSATAARADDLEEILAAFGALIQ